MLGEQESDRTGPTHQVGFVDWFGNVMSSKINKTAFALGRRLRWRPKDDDGNFCKGRGKTRVAKVKAKQFSYLEYFSAARYGLFVVGLSAQAAMRALDHEEEEGHEEEATLSIEARATKSDQGATWNPTETWPAPARRISAGADHSPAFPTRQPQIPPTTRAHCASIESEWITAFSLFARSPTHSLTHSLSIHPCPASPTAVVVVHHGTGTRTRRRALWSEAD